MPDRSQLMPTTDGMNFYTVDPDLAFLLRRSLSDDDFARAQPLLTAMGAEALQHVNDPRSSIVGL